MYYIKQFDIFIHATVFPSLSSFLKALSFSALASFIVRNGVKASGVCLLPPVSSSRMKQWRIAVQPKLKTDKNMEPTIQATKPMTMAGMMG